MAEQFLNEALNSQGGKIYTAARKDSDGKPITDTKLYAEDENGNKVPLKIGADGTVLTQLTGSYVGYSTEDKNEVAPNAKRNDQFLELDTKNVYFHDGSGWVKW